MDECLLRAEWCLASSRHSNARQNPQWFREPPYEIIRPPMAEDRRLDRDLRSIDNLLEVAMTKREIVLLLIRELRGRVHNIHIFAIVSIFIEELIVELKSGG